MAWTCSGWSRPKGRWPFDRAADYIRQAADGLAHAHARNMIHCDIKPSNLLVNTQGVVKILGHGPGAFDQRGGAGAAPGRSHARLGRLPGPRTGHGTWRIWTTAPTSIPRAARCIACLTGHPPFPEGSLSERIVKHQTQEPRSIARQRPDTPEELLLICEKMMAKRPEDRFQSAAEVGQALARCSRA